MSVDLGRGFRLTIQTDGHVYYNREIPRPLTEVLKLIPILEAILNWGR